MAEKTQRKNTATPAAKTLKEKRADKKAKGAAGNFSEDVVSKVKKR